METEKKLNLRLIFYFLVFIMKNRLLIPVLLLWVFVPFAKGQATDWRLLVEQLAEEEVRADGGKPVRGVGLFRE